MCKYTCYFLTFTNQKDLLRRDSKAKYFNQARKKASYQQNHWYAIVKTLCSLLITSYCPGSRGNLAPKGVWLISIMMRDNQAIYIGIFSFLFWWISDTICVLFLFSFFISYQIHIIRFAYIDYSQKHQAEQDAIRRSFDENEGEVLKSPNFSLMERVLVTGVKDP